MLYFDQHIFNFGPIFLALFSVLWALRIGNFTKNIFIRVTGLYAVLVEGDDLDDPVADAARGVLDGHVVLSRELARRGHWPAIDLLESVSRLVDAVTEPDQILARQQVLKLVQLLLV